MTNRNGLPWTASQALAWIIGKKPLKLEEGQWTEEMGPKIKGAQKELAAAIGGGQVQAWGRSQPHGLLEPVPRDPFCIPGLAVIVGEHGEIRSLLPHRRYDGPRWQSIEFDADQIERVFPKPDPAAQQWMLNNASKEQKRDSVVKDCIAPGLHQARRRGSLQQLPDSQRRKRGKPARNSE